MLCPLDSDGQVIRQGSWNQTQKKFRPAILEATSAYTSNLSSTLLGVYVRGSASIGKAKPGLSDLDMVAVTSAAVSKKMPRWVVSSAQAIERRYSYIQGIELGIVSWPELRRSPDYFQLRLNLTSRSVCILGTDVVPTLPRITPGPTLARQFYQYAQHELTEWPRFFRSRQTKTYLGQIRPTSFWCRWVMRNILRTSIGAVMVRTPVFTPDFQDCLALSTRHFPELREGLQQTFAWERRPIANRAVLADFLETFLPTYFAVYSRELTS